MPQAVLFINGEVIRQRGFMAPKKVHDVKYWAKDVVKLFAREVGQGVVFDKWDRCSMDEREIKFNYKVNGKDIGFLIDRKANWC